MTDHCRHRSAKKAILPVCIQAGESEADLWLNVIRQPGPKFCEGVSLSVAEREVYEASV